MDETPMTAGSVEDATGDPGAQWIEPVEEHVTPIDMDSDGSYDAAFGYLLEVGEFALLDSNADGVAEYIEVDTDGDGLVDVTVEAQGDDTWLVRVDQNQDGQVDSEFTLTSDELATQVPGLWQILAGDPAQIATDPATADPGTDDGTAWVPEVEDGQIVGDPFAYSDLWFQQAFDGSCLPASVAQIYSLYTGEPVTDLAFVDLANQYGGWIVDEEGTPGMAPETAVALLEAVGIDASLQTSDLAGLTLALEDGYAVMVAVDSGEIWYGETTEDNAMDHALLVAGIDMETGTVYLSDTGTDQGNMLAVPLDTFLDSWQDSGNTMVVTEETVIEHRGEAAAEPAPDPQQDVTQTPGGDVTQVPPDAFEPSGAAQEPGEAVLPTLDDTGDQPAAELPAIDLTADLPDLVERYEPTPVEQVVRTLVSSPWILLPVALVGARLISSSTR